MELMVLKNIFHRLLSLERMIHILKSFKNSNFIEFQSRNIKKDDL